MEAPRNVIEEIKRDARALEKKLSTIPVPGPDGFSKKQRAAIDQAERGLRGWRGWELGELSNVFSEES